MGTLLLAFYPDNLQQQISSRAFFYKSGRLITDGIVCLEDTPFSADVMDHMIDIDRRCGRSCCFSSSSA